MTFRLWLVTTVETTAQWSISMTDKGIGQPKGKQRLAATSRGPRGPAVGGSPGYKPLEPRDRPKDLLIPVCLLTALSYILYDNVWVQIRRTKAPRKKKNFKDAILVKIVIPSYKSHVSGSDGLALAIFNSGRGGGGGGGGMSERGGYVREGGGYVKGGYVREGGVGRRLCRRGLCRK